MVKKSIILALVSLAITALFVASNTGWSIENGTLTFFGFDVYNNAFENNIADIIPTVTILLLNFITIYIVLYLIRRFI